jgi:alpha-tubulin suppressor-like RCC1 family protein
MVELSSGAKVEIPEGALTKEANIAVRELEQSKRLPSEVDAASKAYAFEPHGTTFEKPVKISIPIDEDAADLSVMKLDDDKDTTWERVPDAEKRDDALVVEVESFSIYRAVRPASAQPSMDAGQEQDAAPEPEPDAADEQDANADAAAEPNDAGDATAADACAIDRDACTPGTITQLSAGSQHACALYSTGEVYCWGSNTNGSGGQGLPGAALLPGRVMTSTNVPLADVTMIASHPSGGHTCALRAGGAVLCWGRNSLGQCGVDAPATSAPRAYVVPDVTGAVAVGVGSEHSCAVVGGGRVLCWGNNAQGQLGNGSTTPTSSPAATAMVNNADAGALEIADAIAVAGGMTHTCIVHADRQRVSCAGSNAAGGGWQGLLGRGTIGETNFPYAAEAILPAGTMVQSLHIGGGFYAGHTCVLADTGRPLCWGTNTYSQLAASGGSVPTPTQLDAYYTMPRLIALGRDFTCIAYVNGVSGGRVACQGTNGSGQLGTSVSNVTSDPIPDDVGSAMDRSTFLSGVELMAAGASFVCVKLNAGGVTCWGDNSEQVFGQTGPARTFADVTAIVPGLP